MVTHYCFALACYQLSPETAKPSVGAPALQPLQLAKVLQGIETHLEESAQT